MSDEEFTTEHTEITKMKKDVNQLTEAVISCAIEVHRALGPGLLESAYDACLCRELSLRDLPCEWQEPIPLSDKGVKVDCGYRADVIVDARVLVEVKAVEQFAPIHDAQLLSYLKLTGLAVGLLINFNVHILTHGIRRKVIGERVEVSL